LEDLIQTFKKELHFYNMDTLEKITKNICDNDPIRISGLLKKRTESVEEFLTKFFTTWNQEKPTIYLDKRVQTEPDKRRSLGDIYLIVHYYYPRIGLKRVLRFLYQSGPDLVPRFRSSFCSTIKKRVFYQGDEAQSTGYFDEDLNDEYGKTIKKWEDLLK